MTKVDILAKCAYCGKSFVPSKGQIKRHSAKVCSILCRNKLNGDRRLNRIKKICVYCGKEFQIKKSRVLNGRGKYCSKTCSKKALDINIEKAISLKDSVLSIKDLAKKLHCSAARLGKNLKENNIKIVLKLTPEECDKRRVRRIGAKHSCETKEKIRTSQLGENGHNWNGGPSRRRAGSYWVTQRIKALQRDNNRCQHCGTKGSKITVHHKVQFRQFKEWRQAHDLNNLISLCLRCHGIEESKKTFRNCKIGANPVIWNYVNLYDCEIGDNVKIGAYTEIGPAIIGDNVTIGSNCFIPEKVFIENNVWCGPGMIICNDRFPPSPKNQWESTLVKKGARIGAAVTILPGVTIGENALIGAGSVLTKSVLSGEVWAGNPASRLIKSTPKDFLQKEINSVPLYEGKNHYEKP